MKRDFPEVKYFSRLCNISVRINGSAVSYTPPNQNIRSFNEDRIFFADQSFFNIFDVPFIYGDPDNALMEANATVISEALARKYFGSEDPLGKTLYLNGDRPLKVMGVMSNWPENSHLKIDMLLSFNTLGKNWGYDEWTYAEFYNYVVFQPGTDPKTVEAKFPAFIEKYLGETMKKFKFRSEFHLQPLTDIHLRSHYLNEAEPNGSESEITFLSIIGVFILIIAWINYINLTTAKSMERAREVSLRKVVGAGKSQLLQQFLTEAFIVNLTATLIAAGMVLLAAPFFETLVGKHFARNFFSDIGKLPSFWTAMFLFLLLTTLVVGLYPAVVISSFKPAVVFRGAINSSLNKISLRRILVSFQFALSIILMAATLIIYLQLKYMQQTDAGYDKETTLVIKSPILDDSTGTSKINYFRNEVLKVAAFADFTMSTDIPGMVTRYRNGVRNLNRPGTDNFNSSLIEVDDHFVQTYNIRMVSGRSFQQNDEAVFVKDEKGNINGFRISKVMINEQLARGLGYQDPSDATNKKLIFGLGTDEYECEIVGVMKDFHQRSFKEKIEPILCYFPPWSGWRFFSIKVKPGTSYQQIANLQKTYSNIFPGSPFDAFFLDDFFNKQYVADVQLGKVFGLFSVLAIIVACLGLVGLSGFVIKLKTKEVGIRKVLGASVPEILLLFSKDFFRLVAVASVVAIPVIYFAAAKWMENYAFHIRLSWFIFLVPPVVLLLVALVTIWVQSARTAMANPIAALRTE
jgi:putative ABC transport system permease protein